jgi:hypothetical protein
MTLEIDLRLGRTDSDVRRGEEEMPPATSKSFLTAGPVLILDVRQRVADVGLRWVDLEPFLDTGRAIRVRPTGESRRDFNRVGHRTLDDPTGFGLRTNGRVVSARGLNASDMVGFRGHRVLPDGF